MVGELGGAFFEGVVLPRRVAVRGRFIQQVAEVDEVLLARGPFVPRAGLPFRDECGGGPGSAFTGT